MLNKNIIKKLNNISNTNKVFEVKITSNNWLLESETGLYYKDVNHNLATKYLFISALNDANDSVELAHKYINDNTLRIYSDSTMDINLYILATTDVSLVQNQINDDIVSSGKTWSSEKINNELTEVNNQFNYIDNNSKFFIKPENVQSFNSSDCSQAFKDIISSGNNILLTGKKYNINGVINITKSCVITSTNKSILNFTNGYLNLMSSNININNIIIEGNQSDNGIYTNGASNCIIELIEVNNIKNFGIAITNSNNMVVRNNYFDTKSLHGAIACVTSENININNNNIVNSGSYGIIFEDNVYNSKIINNYVESCSGVGIGAVNIQKREVNKETNILIENNTIKKVKYQGILVKDAFNVIVNNNNIYQIDDQSPAWYLSIGIEYGLKCGNLQVSNNLIEGFKTSGLYIDTTDNANAIVNDNTIINCAEKREYNKPVIGFYNLNSLIDIDNKIIGNVDIKTISNISNIKTNKQQYSITVNLTDTVKIINQVIPIKSKLVKMYANIKNISVGSFTQIIINDDGGGAYNLDKVTEYEFENYLIEEIKSSTKTSYEKGDRLKIQCANSQNVVGSPIVNLTLYFEY